MFIAKVTSPTTKAKGFVTFTAGWQFIGTVLLLEGKAGVETFLLPQGSNSVTATYGGPDEVNGTSQTIVQIVN
jgi:Bacterial Ig-like domain (group 3)